MIDLTNMPQLIVAYDSKDDLADLIHISKAELGKDYYCPCCGNVVRLRAQDSKRIQSHYYHLNTSCKQESQVHWMYKYYLFDKGCQFYVSDDLFTVDSIEIEKSWDTSVGKYRPDITVYTTDGNRLFFELYFSVKKDENYVFKWQELDSPVIEVDIKKLINLPSIDTPHFEYLYNDGVFYKKEYHKTNTYASTIGTYKEELRRQDYLNYKAHWEKLDWYYKELNRFLSKEITDKDLADTFSRLDLEDMYPCYENIRRTNCVKELKEFFCELINERVNTEIIRQIKAKNEDIDIKFSSITNRTEKCYISLKSQTDYIKCNFTIPCQVVFSSKLHKLDFVDLRELHKAVNIVLESCTKVRKINEILEKIESTKGIRIFIDDVKWLDNYKYFYSKIKYRFQLWNRKELLTSEKDLWGLNWNKSITQIIDDFNTYDFETEADKQELDYYFLGIKEMILKSGLKDRLQDYINKTITDDFFYVSIQFYKNTSFLDMTVYINQQSVKHYIIDENVSLLNFDNIVFTDTVHYIDGLTDMYVLTKRYNDYINKCIGKSWKSLMDVTYQNNYSYERPTGILKIEFKNGLYQKYAVHPELVNISANDNDSCIKKNIALAMFNLLRRAESHGLGLESKTWWRWEKENAAEK